MRLRSTLLLLLVVGLVAAPTAGATLPYWWWTQAKAGRAVVAKNPKLWQQDEQPQTTITAARCRGQRPVRIYRRVRYYRVFFCSVSVRNDNTSGTSRYPAQFTSLLACGTTRQKPLGLRCSISA